MGKKWKKCMQLFVWWLLFVFSGSRQRIELLILSFVLLSEPQNFPPTEIMNSVIHSTGETNGKSAPRPVSGCYVIGMLASPLHQISSSHFEDLNVTKMRHISLLTFCFLTQVYRIFSESLPLPFVLFGFFVMDIWGFLLVLPHTPLEHSWGSSIPLAVVYSSHPGGWTIKEWSLYISHRLQLNNLNLGANSRAGSHEPNHQPHTGCIIYHD